MHVGGGKICAVRFPALPQKARDVKQSLLRKGFRETDKRDHYYYFFYHDNKKTNIFTKISHNETDIGDKLCSCMAKQVRLNNAQFQELVDCPLTQRDVTKWALHLGKSAAFLGTGMGKSFIELEWCRVIAKEHAAPVLLVAPLAVAHQMLREAEKEGVKGVAYHKDDSAIKTPIVVTNYERLDNFEVTQFAGVALGESSILKSFDGKTRSALIEMFQPTPYRLAATATPAPNDFMELGNHAEFLGVMTATEMLSTFFVHDGGETQKWRLKGHAKTEFWKWVCSWAVCINKPSDIGYEDGDFILPPPHYHEHIVSVDTPSEGMLFAMPAELPHCPQPPHCRTGGPAYLVGVLADAMRRHAAGQFGAGRGNDGWMARVGWGAG